ncbi:hypothetical protein [uncultured Anaerococcus sp.]|uniref:hypothetical protein n=1 Tax=uncultured Anaerococcus sp. TaxID=293428 RepID=UPI0025ED671A|nr:hypothetical protein [uncultured Anaerococcus sp.]
MNIDYEKTKKFYLQFEDICNCDMCKFYRESIKFSYPNLHKYLNDKNVDINKAYELGYPHIDDKGNLIYPFAQYIIIGNCEDDYSVNIDNLDIKKSEFYPSIDLEDYFVIEIFDISIDRVKLDERIKNIL